MAEATRMDRRRRRWKLQRALQVRKEQRREEAKRRRQPTRARKKPKSEDRESQTTAKKRGQRQRKIEEKDITGLKFFDQLNPLLQRLHEDGCGRDKAGNRDLHFDQYSMLILLYLFNPIVTSLRGIQQASELAKVQKKLGCSRASLGSLSEAASVFDAQRTLSTRSRWWMAR